MQTATPVAVTAAATVDAAAAVHPAGAAPTPAPGPGPGPGPEPECEPAAAALEQMTLEPADHGGVATALAAAEGGAAPVPEPMELDSVGAGCALAPPPLDAACAAPPLDWLSGGEECVAGGVVVSGGVGGDVRGAQPLFPELPDDFLDPPPPPPLLLALPDRAVLRLFWGMADWEGDPEEEGETEEGARAGRGEREGGEGAEFGTGVAGGFALAATCSRFYQLWRVSFVGVLRFGNDALLGGGRFFDLRFVAEALARYPRVREVVADKAWRGVEPADAIHDLRDLPALRILRFGMHCRYDGVFVTAMVAAAPALRVLDLSPENVRMQQREVDDLLSAIAARPPGIEELRMNAWNLSACNVRQIGALSGSLRTLVLHDFSCRGRPLSQAHYAAMAALRALEELELVGALSSEGLCAVLPSLVRLRRLRLHSPWPRCGDTLTSELVDCLTTNIESVDFNFGGVLSDELPAGALVRFPRLVAVINRNALGTPAPLTNWRLFTRVADQMRVLDLSYSSLVSERGVLAFLARAQNLTVLKLIKCRNIGDTTMHAVVALPRLEVLCVNGTSVTTACKRSLETGACRHTLLTLWLPMTWDPVHSRPRKKFKPKDAALDVSAFTRKGFSFDYDPSWV